MSIFAVYRVGQKKVILTDSQTSACQQWRERRCQGITEEVNPRQETLENLKTAVQQELDKMRKVLILIDANDNIRSRNTEISRVVADLNLKSAHQRHGKEVPFTSKGKYQIDFVLASQGIAKFTTAARICPRGIPWEADHRAIFVDINGRDFFKGKTSSLEEVSQRMFASDNPVKRNRYLTALWKTLEKCEIEKDISALEQKDKVSNEDFNRVDNTLGKAMLEAEKSLRPKTPREHPWTPTLSIRGWTVRFWKRKLNDIVTKRRNIALSEKYRERAQIDPKLAATRNVDTIKNNLRKATKGLRKCKRTPRDPGKKS